MTKKPEIERIAAALHQLADLPGQTPASSQSWPQPMRPVMPSSAGDRPLSFEIQPKARRSKTAKPFPVPPPPSKTNSAPPISQSAEPSLPLDPEEDRSPALPHLASALVKQSSPVTSTLVNVANSTLAMKLLQEMQSLVLTWQQDLNHTLQQIQHLYLEGPILDGWLESYTAPEEVVPSFRHAEVDCLMNYVEKISTSSSQSAAEQSTTSAYGSTGTEREAGPGYRLCGLNDEGQIWFRHCPAEQVPAVSLAIVRYHRLRYLIAQKQKLETRLGQLAETLLSVHRQLS